MQFVIIINSRCPYLVLFERLKSVYAETEMVEGEKTVLGAEGTAEGEADIGSWHSEEDRTLCT